MIIGVDGIKKASSHLTTVKLRNLADFAGLHYLEVKKDHRRQCTSSFSKDVTIPNSFVKDMSVSAPKRNGDDARNREQHSNKLFSMRDVEIISPVRGINCARVFHR